MRVDIHGQVIIIIRTYRVNDDATIAEKTRNK